MRWLALGLFGLVACGGGGDDLPPDAAGVGRICFIGLADGGAPTVIASPALECPSRMCLHVEGMAPDLCTAPCETAADCAEVSETGCAGGMVCAAPVDVGPFACQTMCVCADQVPTGGFPVVCT